MNENENIDLQQESTPLQEKAPSEPSFEDQLKEANEKYIRLYAEFDNFKKRSSKERIELMHTAGKDVLVTILPVLDDFERGLKLMDTASDIQAVKEGVNLVYQKLKTTLNNRGVKEMKTLNEVFDSELHEAITSVPAQNEESKGKIVDELEKGYYLEEKVIRYAKVVVAN